MRKPSTMSLRCTGEFTLDAVVRALGCASVLTPEQAEEISRAAAGKRTHLYECLKSSGNDAPYISPIELIAAFEFPSRHPRKERMDEVELCEHFSEAANIPFIRIDPLKLDAKPVCSIVSKPFARKHLFAPLELLGGELTVAMVNPFDKEAIQGLEDITGLRIKPVLGIRSEILKTINEIFAFEHSLIKAEQTRHFLHDLGNLEQLVHLTSDETPDASNRHIIRAVDLLFQYAYEQRASDIHIEPKRDKGIVRLRIDGRLHTTHSIPKMVHPSFVSRVKIMARMDIAEKRKPQDGRIKTRFRDTEVELRISTVPTAFGEKIVIRIFDPNVLMQDLPSLGLLKAQLGSFEQMLAHPHGIVLVTGPTGSGKTTTLYSALKYLADPEVNITTVEDPIEMVYEPFNQIGVQTHIDLNFTTALRHILRQDPDVIMIGEIRDRETAEYAIQAALTGHLVLSTLHTNNAVSAITRLRDLKVESFLIASTLIGSIAQRLVRSVCPHCSEPARLTPDQTGLLGINVSQQELCRLLKGTGCEQCRHTGYKGRRGIFEIMEMDDIIRALIRDGADEKIIEQAALKKGMKPLMNAAVENLLAGQTTFEEILRVIPLTR